MKTKNILLAVFYLQIVNYILPTIVSAQSFNLLWSQFSNPAPGGASGVAVDGTSLYVVGSDYVSGSDSQWRIEKRNLSTGTVIWTQTINPSNNSDEVAAIAVDGTGLYVVGGIDGNTLWRMEKRDLNTGAVLWVVTTTSSTSTPLSSSAYGVVVDEIGRAHV